MTPRRNTPNAEAAYKKAIEYNPTESAYYVNLSLAQICRRTRLMRAEASIQKAAELNPANAGMAYYNMGATLINRNKPNDAIDRSSRRPSNWILSMPMPIINWASR